MSKLAPVPSISAVEDRIGRMAERHLEIVFRRLIRHPSRCEEPSFLRIISGEPSPFGNLVVVAEGIALPALKAAAEPLSRSGHPACVLSAGGSLNPDQDSLLQELGFQPVGVMPAMAVEIAEVQEIPLAPGYDCRPVESNDLTDWLAAFAVGYELPLGTARLFCPAPETPDGIEEANCQCFLIRKGDQPVATSMVFEAEGLAGIYCVATAPSERGKGLGAVATVAALRAAEMRGYRVGILQSTVMGHSVYRRLGFRDFGGIPMYLKIPGPASS